MKKLFLAIFWIAQFLFGGLAIVAFDRNEPLWACGFLVASFFSMMVGGKVLGIGRELADRASDQVPKPVHFLFKATLIIGILLNVLYRMNVHEISGVHVSITLVQFLIAFFVASAIRDLFLARVYFTARF